MPVERLLSAAERQRVIDERLDELDRLLLGLLPRTERLAIVTDVESRVKALGDDAPLAELPATASAALLARTAGRPAARRSRVALSSGVLGIVSAGCLLLSPILFIVASVAAEALGEEFTIALMSLFVFVLVVGGGLAVFLGGASIIRLARNGQTKTGTGWAITGLCTGLLPMLLGVGGLLTIGAQLSSSIDVSVTPGAVYSSGAVPVQYSQPVGSPPIYGQPVEWNAKVPPGVPMPMLPSAPYAPPPSGPAMLPGPPVMLPAAPPAPSKKPAAPAPPSPPTSPTGEAKEEAAKSDRKVVPDSQPVEEEEKLGIDFED